MRWIPLALAGLLLIPASAAHEGGHGGADGAAMAIAEQVQGQAIYDRIAGLTLDPTTAYRLVGTPTHDNARGWVEEQFTTIGLEPKEFPHQCSGPNGLVVGDVAQRFPNGQALPTPAMSVMALVPGKSLTDWVVIGAHYDTQESTTGALDNAAGVGTMLTIAEAFNKHRGELDASALFVAWDCEEWGVWGSKEFMDRMPDVEKLFNVPNGTLHLRMAVGLDMPGLNWPAANVWPTYHKGEFSVLHVRTSPIDTFGFKSSYGEYNKANYTAAQLEGFRHYRAVVEHAAYDLLGMPRRWVWVEDDTHGRTDHVPFVAHGIPGMRVHGPSDEEYPPYHDAGDTLPLLEQSAGGKDRLIQGLESAARLTALTAALMAQDSTAASAPTPEGPALQATAKSTPGWETGLALVAVAGAALSTRRRED